MGLTFDTLRAYNDRIVCVALTGFGLAAGDDPAFDYVVQAATGVAALTGDPDGPPTLPGYSAADNSAGLHLKALARISRLFKQPQFRQGILAANDGAAIFRLISEEDAKY